jgi:hypothetical protein
MRGTEKIANNKHNCIQTGMHIIRSQFLYLFLLMLAISSWTITVSAQVTGKNPDKVYGYDPLLYNGRVYYYYNLPHTRGNQYLFDEFDQQGALTIRGITYTNVTLNLDLLNQLLILKYSNAIGSQNLIEVSFAWLQKFEIKGRHFEVIATAGTTKEIYQVLGTGPAKILYFQSKKLLIENLTESTDQYYSAIQRLMYVEVSNQNYRYKNNRSFVAAFPPVQHDAVRKYIRKQNLIVQKANDSEMTELINYCNTLTGK